MLHLTASFLSELEVECHDQALNYLPNAFLFFFNLLILRYDLTTLPLLAMQLV